ncbi:site-specific integrase [bacterium]|nr:site-specific integrase [bacterium]
MASRIIEINNRSGFYLEVDKPLWLRQLKGGGNSVKRKCGDTRQEAKRNALKIESQILEEWNELQEHHPLKQATAFVDAQGDDLPDAVSELMRSAGVSLAVRNQVLLALEATPDQLKQQGLAVDLDKQTAALVEGLRSGVDTWQEWIRIRKIEERSTAASTVANWETKFRGLSEWLGTHQVGSITREQAHDFKLFMLDKKGYTDGTCRGCISCYSGFWNWAIRSGKIKTENVWEGLKKGLSTTSNRKPLEADVLSIAEAKADQLEDIRFWFGRYQGLRKEDYCGLRWCDIDIENKVFHIRRYVWQGKKRNLKLKEGGERTVPLHSKLISKLNAYLPEAAINMSDAPIWSDDYRPSIEGWGSRFSERFTDRYAFGTHDLRSYVVTQMLKKNINPYFLKEITGHSVPGLGKVVAGYVKPTLEEVREVLELLD